MNILQVHNRYKITGGEWTVVYQEYNLLKKDHSVHQLIVDNTKEINSFTDKLKLVFTTYYNQASKERVRKKIRETGAEIMHVHNFFPLLSPSIFEAAQEEGIPSILTLHNYRLFHPNGYLLHNSKIDERPVYGSAYACVLDGVYRDSILQTAVVAHMIEYHRKRQTWEKNVDCLLCLTDFAKSKFVEAGFPEKKLKVKPNFVEDAFKSNNFSEISDQKEDFYLFIGRISEEKGVRTLISAWDSIKKESDLKLMILGDGPIKKELQEQTEANSNISWMGFMQREQVMDYLKRAKALVFPSEWYEGMPMTILEAFSAATPIISTNIGSQAEIVEHEKTGLQFEVGNPQNLIKAVERFEADSQKQMEMALAARREYEEKYTPEVNRMILEDLYQQLLKGKR